MDSLRPGRHINPRYHRARSALIGTLLFLTGCASSPALPQEVIVADIDSVALLRRVEVLASDSMGGRRPGTPGSLRARRFILGELQRIGVQPVGGSFEHEFEIRNGQSNPRGVNLIGRIAGTRYPETHIVVTAHYDHVGVGRPVNGDSIYNGADDNASGVSALLAVAEYFRRNPPAATIVFAALDGEEMGLRGATDFVADPPVPLSSIAVEVNMDMVSHSERGELYAVGTSHYPFLRAYLTPVAAVAPIRLLFGHDRVERSPADDWTSQSDHFAFHGRGIPFVYFGVEDHEDYHMPSDEYDSITPGFFVGAARTMVTAVRALDENIVALRARR